MDNPLRLNNFAMGLRELSRIVLHDLAPDADIEVCCWYKEEKNKDGEVVFTRQQRGHSGQGEHRFRTEAERGSGAKVNSNRSEATLEW
jgi:hypothetical protein